MVFPLLRAARPQARLGDPLLPAAGPDVRRCDCLSEPGGVLRVVVENLGPVLDTGQGAHGVWHFFVKYPSKQHGNSGANTAF